ncbi:MAG: lipopolysaccharide biosynthesis protein [Candidatus Omnitrophota bacterium]
MQVEHNSLHTVIRIQALESVRWTFLAEVISRLIQPIVTLILARILLPEDFGLISIAMIVIGLAQQFQDFGFGKTLIQRENEIEKSANIIFLLNIAFSFILYGIIFIIAPLVAKFFHNQNATIVLRILSLQVILISFSIVQQALLRRNFKFKELFFIRIISALFPGFVSIALALSGFGVWALVFGAIASSVLQAYLLWKLSLWRPRICFDFSLAWELFHFSKWISLEMFFGWLILWGDSIILGYFLGVKDLGIYRVGIACLILVFDVIFNPLLPVLFSFFSRLQHDAKRLRQEFIAINRLVALVSLPLGAGLLFFAPTISLMVFGQKWLGIDMVIGLLGIMYGVGWLVGINPEIYRAIGRPDIQPKLLMISVLFYIPVYIVFARYGLFQFCLARLALAILMIPFHLWICSKVMNIAIFKLVQNMLRPSAGVLIALGLVYLTDKFIFLGTFIWYQNLLAILLYLAFYIFLMWIFDRKFIRIIYVLAKTVMVNLS